MSLEANFGRGRSEQEQSNISSLALRGHESLKHLLVDVKYADINKDSARIAELFNQPSAIEHLSGVAPAEEPKGVNVREYSDKHPEYKILISTRDDIKEYYQRRKSNLVLLTANDETGNILGTVTIGISGEPGITHAGVSRLVVDEVARGRGVGKRLLKSANALILSKRDQGGYGELGATAGIIRGVDGEEAALKVFSKEGYKIRHQGIKVCVSWDNKKQLFVERDTLNISLDIRDIQRKNDLLKFLPSNA